MSEFLRPEARAALARWGEALTGGGVLAFGLWLALGWFGVLAWLGWVVAALGAALIYTGIQHARFRSLGQGPGVVEVTERRVTYYGPQTGGMADMDLLSRLVLCPGDPAEWLLVAEGGAALTIPVNAAGAEALFDVFAVLPGVRTEAMLASLRAQPTEPVTVWEAGKASAARVRRLH